MPNIMQLLKETEDRLEEYKAIGTEYANTTDPQLKRLLGEGYSTKSIFYRQAIRELNKALNGKAYRMSDGRVMIPVSDNSYEIYESFGP